MKKARDLSDEPGRDHHAENGRQQGTPEAQTEDFPTENIAQYCKGGL